MGFDTIFGIAIIVGFAILVVIVSAYSRKKQPSIVSKEQMDNYKKGQLEQTEHLGELYNNKICIKCRKKRNGKVVDILRERNGALYGRYHFHVCNRCITLKSAALNIYILLTLLFLLFTFSNIMPNYEISLADIIENIKDSFSAKDLPYLTIWLSIGIVIYIYKKINADQYREEVAYSEAAGKMVFKKTLGGPEYSIVLRNKKGYVIDRTKLKGG